MTCAELYKVVCSKNSMLTLSLVHMRQSVYRDSQSSGEFLTEGVLDTCYLSHLLHHAIHWRVATQLHTRTMDPAVHAIIIQPVNKRS